MSAKVSDYKNRKRSNKGKKGRTKKAQATEVLGNAGEAPAGKKTAPPQGGGAGGAANLGEESAGGRGKGGKGLGKGGAKRHGKVLADPTENAWSAWEQLPAAAVQDADESSDSDSQ